MDAIEGLPGELIDRLVALINSEALGEGAWDNVTFFMTFFVGGAALQHVIPDTGTAPAPGTVGELRQQQGELVSRDRYFVLISDRLVDLVNHGLDEAFLIRSVRDALRRELEHQADVGAGDRKRAEFRDFLLRTAETLSDDEAERLRKSAEGDLLNPTTPESAADRWALLDHWDEQVASLLSDAIFEEWRLQEFRKLRRS